MNFALDPLVGVQALSNEIGNPALMQTVLTDTGSWGARGRAQQILMLQHKVNELQAELNDSRHEAVQSFTGARSSKLC